ncbi:MAG: hypothetical protein KAS32_31305 [Candidatus Peribacteraceae bacterium]|nr:hypothetical protein [Candidatus Peribacteraceae bacterium]
MSNKKPRWFLAKNFIRGRKIGDEFTNQSLYYINAEKSTLKIYLSYLAQAGYLERIKTGQYRYIKELPENITLKALKAEAASGSDFLVEQAMEVEIPSCMDGDLCYIMNED